MKKKETPRIGDIGNVPATAIDAYERAKRDWAERHGGQTVAAGRMFVVALLAIVCAIVAVCAVNGLTPLKTVVPYRIEVDRVSGEVKSAGVVDQKWTPAEANIRFFVGRFATDLVGINSSADITKSNLRRAWQFTRQVAQQQFKDFIATTAPTRRQESEPGLSREVKIMAIQPLNKDTYTAWLQTIERSNSIEGKPLRFRMTIHFVIDPPSMDDTEMVQQNPAGIYITNFQIEKEN